MENSYVYVQKFRVWEQDMTFASETNRIADWSEHWKSYSSTIKNISTTTMSVTDELGGRVVTCREGLQPLKSYDPWSHCLLKSHDKMKPLYLNYHNVYGHQTWLGDDLLKGSHIQKITWSVDQPCQFMWQNETIKSPPPQCLWPPNLAVWWLIERVSYPESHLTHWSRTLVRSYETTTVLVAIKVGERGNDTRAPTYKVTCSFNRVVLRSHVTNTLNLYLQLKFRW